MIIDFSQFTQAPDCDYPVKSYSLHNQDGLPLGDIGVSVTSNGILTINTVDDSLRDKVHPMIIRAFLDNDMNTFSQVEFEIAYRMSDIWNQENACFRAIENIAEIADQSYLSGSELLVIRIPESTDECPFVRSVQVKVDHGEFDSSQLEIRADSITIETPFSVPSAQIGIDIDIELFAEKDDFDIAR